MSKNLLIALLVLGELVLIALAWSQHSRTAALVETVTRLDLVDYRQEAANKELEAQINIARQCINALLEGREMRSSILCDKEAISATAPWGYIPPGSAADKGLQVVELKPLE